MPPFQADSEVIEASEYGVGENDDKSFNYGALFLIQVITSFLSVFATIVVVRISVPKLDSTYQRYIFMLNIASLINSIFLGLHPVFVPAGSAGYWSFGNSRTCTSFGFFLVFGSLMVSFYHTAIAFYFYFSVATIQGNYNNRNQKKKKNGNERRLTRTTGSGSSASGESSTESSDGSSSLGAFDSVAEIVANMVCLFFPAIFAGTAATLDNFDFNYAMNLCTVHGSYAPYEDGWMVMRNIFMWTLVASGASTVLITVVVRCRVRIFQKKDCDDDGFGGTTSVNNKNSNASGSSLSNPDGVADNFERQIIGQKLSAIAAQSLFYSVSYSCSYLWFIILAFVSAKDIKEPSVGLHAIQILTAIFYPLLGVFNCAIYVRPRVQMLQIMYPEDSKIAILRVAMSKAGDPEEIEEVRAKIYGNDYYEPEEDDDTNASNRSDDPGDGEKSRSKLQIPNVVQFDQSTEKRESSSALEEDKNDESVSEISDI